MRSLRKFLINFLFFYSFIVMTTVAQTPFQGLFGFFGSGQSNGSLPTVAITAPVASYAVYTANQSSITVSGTCSLIGKTVYLTIGGVAMGSAPCGSGKTFSTVIDMTSIADGTRIITGTITNGVGTSGSGSVNVEKDVVGPVISFSSTLGFAGGTNSNVSFIVTERHATTSNYTLEISQDNGGTWGPLGVVAGVAGNIFNQSFNYNWNPVNSWNLSTVKIRITSTDSLGQASTQTSPAFVVDSGKPTISVGTFSINSGAGSTSSTSVRLALTAGDTYSNVTQFCFKHTSATEPLLTDGCWTSVTANPPNLTPSTTLTLANFPFSLPPVFGTYDIYAWVRDAGGNISALSNSGAGTNGLDKASIIYVPPIPATLIDVAASSTNTPSTPMVASDLTAAAGASVYIKWNVTDDKVMPASPISLYYTTDDVTYTLIANNIDNTANAGCTISGSQTGCYKWNNGSPLSTYYRIRAMALDSDSSVTAASSSPLNVATTFNALAGNTDPGTGGSANAAIFVNTFTNIAQTDPRSFVVTSAGVIYFLDTRRGLLKVDPTNGVQSLVIRETGVSAGDGLAITNSAVTLGGANEIIMDYQENLYIYETNKIRKIDMSVTPPVISTIIGGGTATGSDILATTLKIAPEVNKGGDFAAFMFASPDGKIYFRSDYLSAPIGVYGKLRYYDPATSKVYTKSALNGVRNMAGTDRDVTTCLVGPTTYAVDINSQAVTYGVTMNIDRGSLTDPNCPGSWSGYMSEVDANTGIVSAITSMPSGNFSGTYLHTGMDGKIYSASRSNGRVYSYDPTTKNWVHILGTGKGSCADGTLATSLSCYLDISDLFISRNSTIYFVDRGRIRMVDPVSNKVYTLYGQSFSSGDGGNPLSARFNQASNVKTWDDAGTTKVVVLDYPELRFREFSIGGTMSTIAGTGGMATPDTTNPASTQPLGISTGATWYTYVVHPTNGKLYFPRNTYLSYIDRSTGKWVNFSGGGATNFFATSSEGLLGNQINYGPGYFPWPLDRNAAGQILVANHVWTTPGITDSMIKIHDEADGKQHHFAGINGLATSGSYFCASGSELATCSVPVSTVISSLYDSFRDKFFIFSLSTTANTIIKLATTGASGTLSDYRALGRVITSLAYKRDAGLTYEWFYYCDTAGRLFKYNNLTSTETQLALPSATMTCIGRGLIYSPSRNSLIYGYSQNGLGGVAEYPNP